MSKRPVRSQGIPEFYSLRYASLPTVSEMLRDEKACVNFGWKCRKSIRWSKIHIEASDRSLLKIAGDTLVDEQKVPLDVLGRLYEIRLKAARWNVDSDDFDKEPKVRKTWSDLEKAISVASQFPGFVYDRVASLHPGWLRDSISYRHQQLAWFTLGVMQLGGAECSFTEQVLSDSEKFSAKMRSQLRSFYNSHGLKMPRAMSLERLAERVSVDLGFGVFVTHDLKPQEPSVSSQSDFKVDRRNSDDAPLLSVAQSSGYHIIKINDDHPYVAVSREKGVDWSFEAIVLSLLRGMENARLTDDQKDDVLSYLHLESRKEARKI